MSLNSFRRRPYRAVGLGLAVLVLLSGTALRAETAPASPPTSVDALWQGYDPRALPIEAEVKSESSGDGIVWRTVYYTSEVVDGFKVRIAAYYGFPAGGRNLPAVMHVHGGGQNATLAYVKYWAHRGYAALSIDWGGKPLEGNPANGGTDWGSLPYNQNADDTGSVYNLQPDVRHNSWYHWTMAARRGITFLEQQPEVDPSHIGAFGISMGGRLAWLIAGTDTRLRCVTSVVGATLMDETQPGVPGSEYVPALRSQPLWRNTLDAWAYAPHITEPFFVLSATDDFYNRIDNGERTLARVPGDLHWRSYSLHFSHHVGEAEAPALAMWMDHWLKNGPAWPRSPVIQLNLNTADHIPRGSVAPDQPELVRDVAMHYSTGRFQQSRFWRTVEPQRSGNTWSAEMPIAENEIGLRAFASVTYANGLVISTNVAMPTAADLRQAHVQTLTSHDRVIDDFRRGAVDWFVPEAAPNVLLVDLHFFEPAGPAPGGAAIRMVETASGGWRAFTRKVGDPQWRGLPGAGIRLQVNAQRPNTITVFVAENYESQPWPTHAYAASAPVRGGNWEAVTFRMSDFKDLYSGKPLASWEHVNILGIVGHYTFSGNHMHLPKSDVGVPWQGLPPEIGPIEWVPAP